MNKHKVMNFLISTGYWTGIEAAEADEDRAYFSAYDEDGTGVDLMVTEENEEYVVYQGYDNEGWVMVDLP
ncbi:hypothetical protein [Paenibacillus donghaensis]|uniref:Uncharacterized protein n=1 Tax=Paenibacillus donghaensis TaxID=414771 RepID=A0A2Z2KTH3_9BACL|nr:hypothetical protein [Paenibacillus donghaensis]ASA22728.1 hypothetical protein B9T62_19165 [Paenibacillus donghaensis]